jgi:hypothetical protein
MTPELQKKDLIEFLHKVEHRFLKPKAQELIDKLKKE